MVTIREWLKKTRKETKEFAKGTSKETKDKFEKIKDKTKQTYNKILDTEIEDIEKNISERTSIVEGLFYLILKCFKFFLGVIIFICAFGILIEIYRHALYYFYHDNMWPIGGWGDTIGYRPYKPGNSAILVICIILEVICYPIYRLISFKRKL